MAVSYAQDIRPLIRNTDIECMRDYDIHLDQLGSVRKNSKLIYQRLSAKEMPEDGPWSDDNIKKFKQWMDDGMQE